MVVSHAPQPFEPWNKGKLVGQKAPLKLKDIWAIWIRLQLGHKIRDLALFNLAIDSKLRACDLVKLRVSDVSHGGQVASLAIVHLKASDLLFRSRVAESRHLSTRQYARIVHRWVEDAGLESGSYGTHTMRRTKASLIYRRTRNLRAVQLLLGHTKLESTVRYLGIDVEDALEVAEQTDV